MIVMSCRLNKENDLGNGVQSTGLVVTSGHIFSAALTSATDFRKWRQILIDMATDKDAGREAEPDWLPQFKQILHGIPLRADEHEDLESQDPGPQQLLLAFEMLARNKK